MKCGFLEVPWIRRPLRRHYENQHYWSNRPAVGIDRGRSWKAVWRRAMGEEMSTINLFRWCLWVKPIFLIASNARSTHLRTLKLSSYRLDVEEIQPSVVVIAVLSIRPSIGVCISNFFDYGILVINEDACLQVYQMIDAISKVGWFTRLEILSWLIIIYAW